MRSGTTATLFVIACGLIGFALGLARTASLERGLLSGGISLAVGFLLMMALKARP
jgi:hypothetical protein